MYVPPNPHDGGLSLGHLFLYKKPDHQVNITYSGLPLLDRDKLQSYIDEYDRICNSQARDKEEYKAQCEHEHNDYINACLE